MRDEPSNDDVFSSNPEVSVTPEVQPEENQAVIEVEDQIVADSIAEPTVATDSTPIVEPVSITPVAEPVLVSPVVEPATNLPGELSQSVNEPFVQPAGPIGSGPELGTPTPISPQPNKKRKGLILGAIIAGAVLLLGGGSVSAYTFWYQNPEKVVTDALVHAITAKTVSATGVVTVEGTEGYTLKVEASGRNSTDANATVAVKLTLTSDELNVALNGEGIFSKDGDIYLKVTDLQKLLDSFEEQSNGQVSYDAFSAVVKKIDSKWIKIGKDDLKDVSEDMSKTQTCFAEISKKLESDKSFRNKAVSETEKLYKENNFITIGKELPSRTVNGQDSKGYPVTGDQTKAKAFFKGFGDTQLGKEMQNCDDSLKFSEFADDYNSNQKTESTIELWVSRFGHEITEVNWKISDNEAKGSIVVNPVFNKNEAVVIPAESVKWSEVVAEFEKAYGEMFTSYQAQEYTNVNYN